MAHSALTVPWEPGVFLGPLDRGGERPPEGRMRPVKSLGLALKALGELIECLTEYSRPVFKWVVCMAQNDVMKTQMALGGEKVPPAVEFYRHLMKCCDQFCLGHCPSESLVQGWRAPPLWGSPLSSTHCTLLAVVSSVSAGSVSSVSLVDVANSLPSLLARPWSRPPRVPPTPATLEAAGQVRVQGARHGSPRSLNAWGAIPMGAPEAGGVAGTASAPHLAAEEGPHDRVSCKYK